MTQHDPTLHTDDQPSTHVSDRRQGIVAFFGMAMVVILLIAGAYVTLRGNGANANNPGGTEESEQQPADVDNWEKPLFAIVVSGQMHGYIDPCGCSDPQYGGLTRRFNFMQSLKAKQWDVVGIDLGDLPQLKGIPEQNLLKFDLTVKALAAMNYKAFGIGKDEIEFPLGAALAPVYDEKRPHPRPLALTLGKTGPGELYHGLNVRPYEIIATTNSKIGVINMMGPDMREELNEQFLPNMKELPKALDAFAKAGVEFGVILHHEHPKLDKVNFPEKGIARAKAVLAKREEQARLCAIYCAEARQKNPRIPAIQLMVVLSDDPEPPGLTNILGGKAGPTQVVEIGHKGKYVGLVGVYRDKSGFRMQYQTVLMAPKWNTPPGDEKKNAVIALLEKYNQALKADDMLAKAPRSPHFNQVPANGVGLKATFVGSKACQECHDHAFKIWAESAHAKATNTLEDLKHPSGRQYDPECMKCHTTGFEHPGGYHYPIANLAAWKPGPPANVNPVQLEQHNTLMRGVGCESCHGPGSEHVNKPANKMIRDAMNPFRKLPQEKMVLLNRFCIQCHDSENDVHWGDKGHEVQDRWMKIIHRTPPVNNNNK